MNNIWQLNFESSWLQLLEGDGMLHKFSNNPNQPSYCNNNHTQIQHRHCCQPRPVNLPKQALDDSVVLESLHKSQWSRTTVSRGCFTLELPVWSGIIITSPNDSLLQLTQLNDKQEIHKEKLYPLLYQRKAPMSHVAILLLFLPTVGHTIVVFVVVCWLEGRCPQWPGWLLIAYSINCWYIPVRRVLKPPSSPVLKHNICRGSNKQAPFGSQTTDPGYSVFSSDRVTFLQV